MNDFIEINGIKYYLPNEKDLLLFRNRINKMLEEKGIRVPMSKNRELIVKPRD
jgi:hypothetical protein